MRTTAPEAPYPRHHFHWRTPVFSDETLEPGTVARLLLAFLPATVRLLCFTASCHVQFLFDDAITRAKQFGNLWVLETCSRQDNYLSTLLSATQLFKQNHCE